MPDSKEPAPPTAPAEESSLDRSRSAQAMPSGHVAPAPPGLSASDPTRTSRPDPPADLDPTRTRQPEPAGPTTPVASPPAVPQIRNPARYQILGEHGRGGLGKVSRAHDLELGRDIAIKEMLSGGVIHEVRFMREALITARLEHPGIVPVHEAGRWPDGTPFYAMKLVAGRPLRHLLAERKSVGERIALLHHVIAVADAIAYAHGRHIIHRDLKPSNVIIGDFGETVVIDWGLAKDLSVSEPATTSGSSLRTNRDDDLTSAGVVLGTPAYMAPEQQRGEQVDQRADVHAIGAMLWELCSLEKLPPHFSGQRLRMLREAGIDPDLVTIINKALAPDPDSRYPDAGALASDLKAFKAGARIASRRYSAWATLQHWIRRHRALAVVVSSAFILLALGAVLYVRIISAERDRADDALAKMTTAQKGLVEANQTTQRAYQDISLKNAELLSKVDPSAAWDVLKTYRGTDEGFAKLLKAKVQGLGIAKFTLSAHKDTIMDLEVTSTGHLLSVSEDGILSITGADGQTEILASNGAPRNINSFSDSRGLLAYACQPLRICLIDVVRPQHDMLYIHESTDPISVALSPAGQQLAVGSRERLILWQLNDSDLSLKRKYELHISNVRQLLYVSDARLLAATADRVYILNTSEFKILTSLQIEQPALAGNREHILLGDKHGRITSFALDGTRRLQYHLQVCQGSVYVLKMLISKAGFAYGCQDGTAGTVALDAPGKAPFSLHAGSPVLSMAISPEDRYIAFGAGGIMYIIDTKTNNTILYRGQNTRLVSVSAPTASFPYFSSGDDDGYVRIWNIPSSVSRPVIMTNMPLLDSNVLGDGTVIAVGGESVLRWYRDGNTGSLPAHKEGAFSIRRSPDHLHFLTFGREALILWQANPLMKLREIIPAPPGRATFLNDGMSVVSGGSDGKLLLWKPDDTAPQLMAQFSHPLVEVEILRPTERLIVAERDGTIWELDLHTMNVLNRVKIGHVGMISYMATSNDGNWVGVGTSRGEVLLYESNTWRSFALAQNHGVTHMIKFSSDASMISAISEDGYVHLLSNPVKSDQLDGGSLQWRRLALNARSVEFSPDGEILAITVSKEGVFWFSLRNGNWYYVPSLADIFRASFSMDGQQYVTADGNGRVTLFDVKSIVKSLSSN